MWNLLLALAVLSVTLTPFRVEQNVASASLLEGPGFGLGNVVSMSTPPPPEASDEGSPEGASGTTVSAARVVKKVTAKDAGVPIRVRIPSIGLDSPIIGVGVNKKGEMDVPSGSTNHVGWYQHGTLPGRVGSAVLDAHVYAAFSELHKAKVGSDIYIDTSTGVTLHFVVDDTETSALASISAKTLFNRADARRLNLITCAGTYIQKLGTYDMRHIVYALYRGASVNNS